MRCFFLKKIKWIINVFVLEHDAFLCISRQLQLSEMLDLVCVNMTKQYYRALMRQLGVLVVMDQPEETKLWSGFSKKHFFLGYKLSRYSLSFLIETCKIHANDMFQVSACARLKLTLNSDQFIPSGFHESLNQSWSSQ